MIGRDRVRAQPGTWRAARHHAISDHLVHDPGDQIHRNGEVDPVRIGLTEGEDTDHPTVRVQQWSTGAPRVDDGVGLDGPVQSVLPVPFEGRKGADDSGRHRPHLASLAAHRNAELAESQVRGAAQGSHHHAREGRDVQQRETRLGIDRCQVRCKPPARGKDDVQALGAKDDVGRRPQAMRGVLCARPKRPCASRRMIPPCPCNRRWR